jgi:copper chaperone CopZ
MACEGCAENIDDVLQALAGVHEVRPDVSKKRVRVSFEPGRVSVQQLRNALTAAGYTTLGTA